MASLEQQLEWERHHRERGRLRMAAQLKSAREQGRVTDTPLGSVVLRRYLLWLSQKLAKDITEDLDKPGRAKAYSPLLKSLDPDAVALVSLSVVLQHVFQEGQVKMNSLGLYVGRALYSELALASFRDMLPDLYEVLTEDLQKKMSKDLRHRMTVFRMQAAKNGKELPEWTPTQKLQVGIYMIGLMADANEDGVSLVDFDLRREGKQTTYYVTPSPAVSKITSAVENAVIARSGHVAPCLVPPQDWTGEPNVGGFHGDLKVRAVRFFKGTSDQWDIMNAEGHDPSLVLKMLNYHQKTAWKVNPYILDVLKGMRQRGYSIHKKVEFSSFHEKLRPERPEFLDSIGDRHMTVPETDQFMAWKTVTRIWHTEARRISRVEMRYNMAIDAAEEMKDIERFFYVYQVDNRSRMYPVSGVLNPQGSDVQKALLHSAHGLGLCDAEALWWFKLSAAAKYGIDKLSPEECVRWFDDNSYNILRAAEDPLDREAFSWWSAADKPLQFIAVCDEFLRYTQDPVNFVSRIAVAMDGTCNGLQNYSALLRDEVGGAATNLISRDDGIPSDIYGEVATASFRRLLQAELTPVNLAWQAHGFNRKLTKKSVMTQVYGSTFGTCRKSIMEYCYDNELFAEQEFEHAEYAAKMVWVGIGDVVVKAKAAMDWLRDSAGLVMKEGAEYITWLAPSGFRVVQIYTKYKDVQVRAHVGQNIRLRINDTDKPVGPNKMRHRNAFPPNFIHSVDASHMAFVSVAMKEEFGEEIFLHFIHDDFGALPALAAALYRVIREQFVVMHEGYSLESIREQYPFIKAPPKRGKLDIRCVLDSVNFFR